ncbi:FAD-dependent oxidoreductase [Phytomonospora sp. NPDC050363]|uniref:flavin monoamine oxidase family protein n=1 Tax=Phytomonospora sp. NPDC050363 TaxID=3155642 RepID=UPI0034058976
MNEAHNASRRRFLTGAAATAGGMLAAMTGLGPTDVPAAATGRPRAPEAVGTGKTVLVLGAGIAGLTAAYELAKQGYTVEVLEAQQRAGGRSLTARTGSVVTEVEGDGRLTTQKCVFDEGLYLNLGPGRIPYHHRRVLRYCTDLKVPLEVYVPETAANLVRTERGFGGTAQINRRVTHDTRGHLAALLSKAVERGALDTELSPQRRTRLLSLLASFGDLPRDKTGKPLGSDYNGSTRCGYLDPLDVHNTLKPMTPLDLREIIDADYWLTNYHQPMDHLWQSTMFQPVGGMDQIAEGFLRALTALKVPVTYGAVVTSIDVKAEAAGSAVLVGWSVQGRPVTPRRVDYCLSSIPFPVLQTIKTNFSPTFDAAVKTARFAPACKVGWQANSRFWESDDNQMYGGISRVDHLITQVWYPSYDYFTAKGTLTGCYNSYENATRLGALPHEKRLETAREGGRLLHKEFGDDTVIPNRQGMSIAWHKVQYQLGGWADWIDTPADRVAYGRLLAPDGRFHIIGDQVSPLPGWKEGAMMSAQYVAGQVMGLESTDVPKVRQAPDSRALTTGRI